MAEPTEEEILILKKEARIRELCAKHELEVDEAMGEIIRYIAEGYFIKGLETMITKDWLINMELKLFSAAKRDGTRQRIIEHLSELMGHMPEGKGKADVFADVTIGALNEEEA